jgi:hypothetical protein
MAKGGLGKWFGEDWRDIKTGEKCGRSASEKAERAYPACRPASAASRMTSGQKVMMAAKKIGSERESWPVSPSGKKK